MGTQPAPLGFIINSLGFGGAERVFVRDTADFAEAGHTVHLFVLYGTEHTNPLSAEVDPRVLVHYVQAHSAFDLRAVQRVLGKVRAEHLVTLLSTLNDANIFARWIKLLHPGPRWIPREANPPHTTKTWWQRILDATFFWLPYRILAVSEETRAAIVRTTPFARGRTLLLPNGVDVPTVVAKTSSTPPRILSVGSLTEQKNHAALIGALAEVRRAGVAFTADIIGAGVLKSTLEKQIAEAGLENQVALLGSLPATKVHTHYAAADLFVLSSSWEGSPNVVLEAMSYGLPIVATRVGGVPDMLQDGKEGVLVPAGDTGSLAAAIGALLADPGRGRVLGMAARERVAAQFSRTARFQRLQRLIQGI